LAPPPDGWDFGAARALPSRWTNSLAFLSLEDDRREALPRRNESRAVRSVPLHRRGVARNRHRPRQAEEGHGGRNPAR
jgi:hypothetical protein